MTLRDQMDTDVQGVFLNDEEHAETVTYTPENGTGRSVLAVVDEISGNRGLQQQQTTQTRTITTAVYRNATTGITTVKRGDTLTWNSEVWSNPTVQSGDANMQTIRWELPIIEGTGRIRRSF